MGYTITIRAESTAKSALLSANPVNHDNVVKEQGIFNIQQGMVNDELGKTCQQQIALQILD